MSDSTTSNLTPYGASVLANTRFKEEGINPIPPQMMYNYTTAKLRAGKNPLIKFSPETGVDRVDFERWLERYVAKKNASVQS
jgi:hypothetical protein